MTIRGTVPVMGPVTSAIDHEHVARKKSPGRFSLSPEMVNGLDKALTEMER